MKNRPLTTVLAVVSLLAVSAPTTAHHGSAAFDVGKEVTLEGTVTEWIWSNPHCLLRFDVTDDSGNTAPWVAETQNPRNMANSGWSRTSFKAGDRVTVTIQPVKNGRRLGRILRVVFPDGRELS